MKTLMCSATAIITIFVLVLNANAVGAHDQCSDSCGCKPRIRKVCRLVCETEEVTGTKFDCECEDFCIPGPSEKCDVECECDCKSHHGKSRPTAWKPSRCAEVRTRKKLVIKEEKKEVPKYRWVVEYVCDECGCRSKGHLAADDPATPSNDESAISARRSITQVLFGQ